MAASQGHAALGNALLLADIEVAQDEWLKENGIESGQPEHWAQKVVKRAFAGVQNVVQTKGFVCIVARPAKDSTDPSVPLSKSAGTETICGSPSLSGNSFSGRHWCS